MKLKTFDAIAHFLLVPPAIATIFSLWSGIIFMILAWVQFLFWFDIGFTWPEYIILVYLFFSGILWIVFIQFDNHKR